METKEAIQMLLSDLLKNNFILLEYLTGETNITITRYIGITCICRYNQNCSVKGRLEKIFKYDSVKMN